MSQKGIEEVWFDDVIGRKWVTKSLQHIPDSNIDICPLKVINDYYAYCYACRIHIYSRTTVQDPYSQFSKHVNELDHRIAVEKSGKIEDAITYDETSQIWTCNACKINLIPKFITQKQSLEMLINNHTSMLHHKYNAFCMADPKMSFLMGMSLCTNLKYFLSRTKNNVCCLCDKTIWEDVSLHERTHGHLQAVRQFLDARFNFKLDEIKDEEKVMNMLKILSANVDWRNLLTTSKSDETMTDTRAVEENLENLAVCSEPVTPEATCSTSDLQKSNIRVKKERHRDRDRKNERKDLTDKQTIKRESIKITVDNSETTVNPYLSPANKIEPQPTQPSGQQNKIESIMKKVDLDQGSSKNIDNGTKRLEEASPCTKTNKIKNVDLDKNKTEIAEGSCDKLSPITDKQVTNSPQVKSKKINKKDKMKDKICDGSVSQGSRNKGKQQITSKAKMERNKSRKSEKESCITVTVQNDALTHQPTSTVEIIQSTQIIDNSSLRPQSAYSYKCSISNIPVDPENVTTVLQGPPSSYNKSLICKIDTENTKTEIKKNSMMQGPPSSFSKSLISEMDPKKVPTQVIENSILQDPIGSSNNNSFISKIDSKNWPIEIKENYNDTAKESKLDKSKNVDLLNSIVFENSNKLIDIRDQDVTDSTSDMEQVAGGIETSSSNSDDADEEKEEVETGDDVNQSQLKKKGKDGKVARKREKRRKLRESSIQQFWCDGCCNFDEVHKLAEHMKTCTAWSEVEAKNMICHVCDLVVVTAATGSLDHHYKSESHIKAYRLRRKTKSLQQVEDLPKAQDLRITGLSGLDERLLVVLNLCKGYGEVQSARLSDNGDEAIVRFWFSSSLHKALQDTVSPPLSFSIKQSTMADGLENAVLDDKIVFLLSDGRRLNEECWNKSQMAVEVMKSLSEQNAQAQLMDDLYSQVGKCLGDDWQFLLFGSRRTGLSLTSSDADVFAGTEKMYFGREYQSAQEQRVIVEHVEECIKKSESFEWIKSIPKTRIPIVIFRHIPTGIQCDLSFKNGLSVRNTALIRFLLSLDERPRAMIMFLKEWVTSHGLKYILTSYTVALLVFVFLARLDKPVLPVITQLRPRNVERVFIGGMNASFSDKILWRTTNKQTVPQLLYEFFYFYATFDFANNFIYTVGASIHPRRSLRESSVDLPVEVKRASRFIMKYGEFDDFHQMCVMDPFDLKINTTGRIKHHAYHAIKHLFKQSYLLLHQNF